MKKGGRDPCPHPSYGFHSTLHGFSGGGGHGLGLNNEQINYKIYQKVISTVEKQKEQNKEIGNKGIGCVGAKAELTRVSR